jgi:glycosyltransferase involved in cell wall biosynthesis
VRFGWGLFLHLLRNAKRYDAILIASFPFFSVLGAHLALRMRRAATPLVVDWLEVWPRDYWRGYSGPVLGRVGAGIQHLCLAVTRHAIVHSEHTGRRLREAGYSGSVHHLPGQYDDRGREASEGELDDREPLVIFVGRHIPEKQVMIVPAVVKKAQERIPALRCRIYGDGPERERVEAEIARLDLQESVRVQGTSSEDELNGAFRSAACLLHPSIREGFGLVIVEAAAGGTPAVIVAAPENAAVELVRAGYNGQVVGSTNVTELADAVATIVEQRDRFARQARTWYEENAQRLSVRGTAQELERLLGSGYGGVGESGGSEVGAPGSGYGGVGESGGSEVSSRR